MPRQTVATVIAEILAKADLYEIDGEPGPLGYNCWGWRDIAKILRHVADEIEGRCPS